MGRLRDNIAKEKARRTRRLREGKVTRQAVRLKATEGERNNFTAGHAPLLLAIESLIVTIASAADFEDSDVAAAIRAILEQMPSTSLRAQQLVTALNTEQERLVCDDETWDSGLRVVYRSLSMVSDCRRGEKSYLKHAANFVQNATATRDRKSRFHI